MILVKIIYGVNYIVRNNQDKTK